MIRFKVRLTPNGGRDAVDGWSEHLGERVLKVRVTAIPEKGKANAALIALLAKALHLPKSQLRIASGDGSRLKTLELIGDVPGSAHRLQALGEQP